MKNIELSQIKTQYKIINNTLEFIFINVPVDISLEDILSNNIIKNKIYNDINIMTESNIIQFTDIILEKIQFKFVIEYNIANIDIDLNKSDNLLGAIYNKLDNFINEKKLKEGLLKLTNENIIEIIPELN